MKRVIIAGMPRSGSTWQYNVVRLAYIAAGYDVYGAALDNYHSENKADVHIVKAHAFDSGLIPCKVLATVRNCFDAFSSLEKKDGFITPEQKIFFISHFWEWFVRAEEVYSFESIVRDKVAVARAILERLDLLEVDPAKIVRAVEALPIPESGRDEITLLHERHKG